MNRNKHKILVLSDLKENAQDTIAYAITVAKEINGAVELLCVKKPNEIVTTHNQLSAMRNVNNEFIKSAQKAKKITRNITHPDFFPVKNTIVFGNVKNEIELHIQKSNPDFIILGQKRKKILNFNSDNVTEFIKKKYKHKYGIANKTSIAEIYEALHTETKKGLTA
ncbi:universal stress protein [Polaribacter sp. R77954]|uniref:universal stress protein n=1 Tax=Polaribacter sp. R77954 TaxID=3093870 RepID=UPI0037C7821E